MLFKSLVSHKNVKLKKKSLFWQFKSPDFFVKNFSIVW